MLSRHSKEIPCASGLQGIRAVPREKIFKMHVAQGTHTMFFLRSPERHNLILVRVVPIGVVLGLSWGNIRIVENEMKTTTLLQGYLGRGLY